MDDLMDGRLMPRRSWEWLPTYLYRLFDADGQLLYVGISCYPASRIPVHRWRQPWGREIVDWDISDPIPSRDDAMAAERTAIRSERPRYNIVGAVTS